MVIFWDTADSHVRQGHRIVFSLQDDVAVNPKHYRRSYDRALVAALDWLKAKTNHFPEFPNEVLTRLVTENPFLPRSRSNTALKIVRLTELVQIYQPENLRVSGVGLHAYQALDHLVRSCRLSLTWGFGKNKFFSTGLAHFLHLVTLGARFWATPALLVLDFLKFTPLARARRMPIDNESTGVVLVDYRTFPEFLAQRAGPSERFRDLRKEALALGVETRTVFLEPLPSRKFRDRFRSQGKRSSKHFEVLLNSYWCLGILLRSLAWTWSANFALLNLWTDLKRAPLMGLPGLFLRQAIFGFTGRRGASNACVKFLWEAAFSDFSSRIVPLVYVSEGQYWEQAMLRAAEASHGLSPVGLIEFPVADAELRVSNRVAGWMVRQPKTLFIGDWGQVSRRTAKSMSNLCKSVKLVFPNRLGSSQNELYQSCRPQPREESDVTVLVLGEAEEVLNVHLLQILVNNAEDLPSGIKFVFRPHPANPHLGAGFSSFFGASIYPPSGSTLTEQLRSCSAVLGLAKSYSLVEAQAHGVRSGGIVPPSSLPRFVRINTCGTLMRTRQDLHEWTRQLRPKSAPQKAYGGLPLYRSPAPDITSEVLRMAAFTSYPRG